MNADEVTRLLDELATRLEGPARYAFDLAVRQVFIEGVAWVIVGSIIAAVGLVAIAAALRSESDDDGPFMALILGGAAFIGGLLATVFAGLVDRALNPEWAALMRLVDTIR